NTRFITSSALRLKHTEIPPRYYLRHENILLFQAGKIPNQLMNSEDYNLLLQYFALEDAITLIDNEAGIKYFDHEAEENADIVLILVSPEYESIRIAEKVNRFSKHRNMDNVYAVLNNIPSENVEMELKQQLILKGIHVIGTVYHDDDIRKAALRGEMIPTCRALQKVSNIVLQIRNRMLTMVFSS
ncbi:MAG: hypothetical protein KFF73_06330, partial [Cyclobacteriaceae bacterium]|nr:hypothetical protein [Cyclobacteriaceae bacterium]